MSKPARTSKSQIAQWWYEYAQRAHDAGKIERIPEFAQRLWMDLGEPNCWGCDGYLSRYDISGWTLEQAYKNYNRLPLERAHIIPAARGGLDKPNNFVLLRPRCHRDSPDTTNPLHLFRWMRHRRGWWEIQFKSACECSGMSLDVGLNLYAAISWMGKTPEWLEYSVKTSVPHFDEYAISTEIVNRGDFLKKEEPQVYEKAITLDTLSFFDYLRANALLGGGENETDLTA